MVRIIVLLALLWLPSTAQAEARIALLIDWDEVVDVRIFLSRAVTRVVDEPDGTCVRRIEPTHEVAYASENATSLGVLDRRKNFEALFCKRVTDHGDIVVGVLEDTDRRIVGLIADAKEPGTTTFWDESLKLDDVLRLLDGARSAAKFIVFDACRNELQLPTKDSSKGLATSEGSGLRLTKAGKILHLVVTAPD